MRVHSFKAIYPNKSLLKSQDDFFTSMGKDFSVFRDAGLFTENEEDSMYAYEIKHRGRKQRGIVNNTEIQDFLSGKILRHEQTIPAKEQVMVDATIDRKAMIKPIMLFHKKNEKLSKLIDQVIDGQSEYYNFELEDGSVHTLWQINDENTISKIKNIFIFGIAKAFIADGHHRFQASYLLHQNKEKQFENIDFSKVLTAYFSEEEVEIYDHAKMVNILDTIDKDMFIEELSEYASVRSVPKFTHPENRREFFVLIKGEMFKGKWKKKTLKDFEISLDALDNYIMNQIVFGTILHIPDVRTDDRISFFSSHERSEMIIKRSTDNPMSICILQSPLSISEVKQYSTKKKNLPPKSTWFEPRIKSGVIGQKL